MTKKHKQVKSEENWVVAYKRVHRTADDRYLSAWVHGTPISLEYKLGEITKAKVGAIFCLPNQRSVIECPVGNATLKVFARGKTKAPDQGATHHGAHTIAEFKNYWRPNRKGTFDSSYFVVFYKEVFPIKEV